MTAADRLRELRATWSGPRAPDDPAALPGRLTGAIDALILEIVHGRNTSGWAVVAVGGYGRSEMCLHSDIDVMLLGDVPPDAVRQVLYPLWDTGMKVGHSVRTVKEAVTAAGENIETLCSLLTTRVITGDPEPVAELNRHMVALVRRQRSLPEALGTERARGAGARALLSPGDRRQDRKRSLALHPPRRLDADQGGDARSLNRC